MKKELEKRLVDLVIAIHSMCKSLDNSFLSEHLKTQILRSSTSAALNYGEAQVAESRKDFVHKSSVVLKELKETSINLELLKNANKEAKPLSIDHCENECSQLLAIFQKTVITAKKNNSIKR